MISSKRIHIISLTTMLTAFAATAMAADTTAAKPAAVEGAACEGFGPQTPRDIDAKVGNNKRAIAMAPDYKQLNLCNIHFHTQAEHKAKAFSLVPGGDSVGFQCNETPKLSKAELVAPAANSCKGLKPGDTIEVHWVHSSCDVKPGKGLGSCLSASCANPDLRVESQVFMVVNDKNALDFTKMGYGGNVVNGFHQAKAIPSNTGKPVQFIGSTTGPQYTEATCSPLQVTWSVRPSCAKVDINSLSEWCKSNEFAEDHPHGVRKLVTNTKLLSAINSK